MANYLGMAPEDLSAAYKGLSTKMPVGNLTSGLVTPKPKIPTSPMPVGSQMPAAPGFPVPTTSQSKLPGSGPTAPTGLPQTPIPGLPSGFGKLPSTGTMPPPPTGSLGPLPNVPVPKLDLGQSKTQTSTPTVPAAPVPPMTAGGGLVGPGNMPMPVAGPVEPPAASPPMTAGGKLVGAGNKPMPVQGPVEAPAPVQPMTAGGKLVGPGNTPKPEVAPTPAAPTAPALDPLAEFETFARGRMMGTDDEVLRVAANRVMDRLALMNQAEKDALQMRINQDPSLRGQGAGYALLQSMARNQNFTAGELFAGLAEDSRQRILDMQQWGFEGGMKVNEVRRTRAVENFGTLLATGQWDAAGAALQSIIDRDLPGSGIKVNAQTFANRDALTRSDWDTNLDTIRTLALTDKAGATAQVAALMAQNPERFPPGMTPEQYMATLEEEAKRDTFTLSQFASQMQTIKDIASVNPQAAAGLLSNLMANPMYKGWFQEGMTAEQLIQSFTAANVGANLTQSNQIQAEINKVAAAGQSFNEVAGFYDDLFRLTGRDAAREGRGLSLDRVNEIRTADGLGAFQKDAQGNLVDENGIPLTDEDFAELAYRADYFDRVNKAKNMDRDYIRDRIMSSSQADRFLDESLFPGSKNALESYIDTYLLGAPMIKDPQTGLMVPDTSQLNIPWQSPAFYHIYFTWPRAVFDEAGQVKKDASGNLMMDMGGDVYGEMLGDQKVVATPKDQELDSKWVKYQRSGGKLTAPEWYFATAGGTRPPNEAAIPKEVGGEEEDFQDIGKLPETVEEEKNQILATLKPSQKPPDGNYTRTVTKTTKSDPIPGVTWDNSSSTKNVTEYWNPDTGQYEGEPNNAYRALYGGT